MDLVKILNLFKTNQIKLGPNQISLDFCTKSREEILKILNEGYYPFTCDFPMILSALLGANYETSKYRYGAVKDFIFGKSVSYPKDLFSGMDIRLLRVSSREKIYCGLCIPIIIIYNKDTDMWGGTVKGRYKECTMEKWISTYYDHLLNIIKFLPNLEYFDYDFRYISVYRPEIFNFVMEKVFLADNRDLVTIKKECYEKFMDVPQCIKNVTNNMILRASTSQEIMKIQEIKKSLPPLPPSRRSPRKNYKRTLDVHEEDIDYNIKKRKISNQ